ncbi:hypothetical protein CCYA_CCYA16G4075 [Cyanidiococcus yangmingshanensis]|nr:hypothetical protein CCYA_CCYA16G4075 [Cyanidiococcus yangmingshanensis]
MFVSLFVSAETCIRSATDYGARQLRGRWSRKQRHHPMQCCQEQPRRAIRERLEQLLGGLLASAWLTTSSAWVSPVPAIAANQYTIGMDRGVQAVIICRELLEPIPRYVEDGAWDKARSNVNYCTRTLRLKSALRAVTDQLLTPEYDLDRHETAKRLVNDLPNLMTQLDATLYTPIFIASDQGVSPGQRKYGNEALDYLGQAKQMLECFLELIPEDVMTRNVEQASKMRVPLERQ